MSNAPIPSPGQIAPDADKEARRDVLKRFGRYAAAAPTVMLLLASRAGQAQGRPPWVPGPPPSTPPSNSGGYN
jgi:hypothetical protein